jgi:diacylglycerol kinase (ATP)
MKKFLKGFFFAGKGIWWACHERNMRVHLVAVWIVALAGIYFRITSREWMVLLLCFALVLSAEAFNTAFEYVVNLIRDECHVPYANKNLGKAKDIAAGAVLICAACSAIVGAFIFLPYML